MGECAEAPRLESTSGRKGLVGPQVSALGDCASGDALHEVANMDRGGE